MTIYLATITAPNDYTSDTVLDREAFSTKEKAVAFLVAAGLVEIAPNVWENPDNFNVAGDIDELSVR